MVRAVTLLMLCACGSVAAQEFEYRTFTSGLGSVTGANGVAVADYDLDGDLDVYVVVRDAYDASNTRTWNRLFGNRGDGTFTDRTRQAGVAGEAGVGLPETAGNGGKIGAAWGDYDGDGDPDLYLTHAGPNQLYRNDGDGTFTDVTAEAGVAGGPAQLSTSPLWFDADGDGDLDLHVGVWEDYAPGDGPRDMRNPFYLNLGDGTFREASAEAGLGDTGKTYTTLPFDADGDGDLDLYDANDFGANRFYRNDGGTFTEATAAFGLEDRGEGMGLALGDADGDGLGDVYLTNRSDSPTQTNRLFVAASGGGFSDRAPEAGVDSTGWAWGTAFFDLENDGDEDLFVVNGYFAADSPNSLFVNDGTGGFMDVAEAWGVADAAPGRGLAVFDADRDGRLEVLVANVAKAPSFYGTSAKAGAWLSVALEGSAPNTAGWGAVVTVEGGGRRWVRFHHGAQFLGQNLVPVHVGMGNAEAVDRVTVRWPDGSVDEAVDLAVSQAIRIRQGEGLVGGRGVSVDPSSSIAGLRVLGVGPNPARGAVWVQVEAPAPLTLDVAVVDLLGRTVRRIRSSVRAGRTSVAWDTRTEAGGRVAPGTYHLVLASPGHPRLTVPVVVIR